MTVDPALFKAGMRRLACGVWAVTTVGADGERHGMLATSVAAASADPASLLVCINRSASCHDPIHRSGAFCVNLLSEEDEQMARAFSSSEARRTRFASGDWRTLATGAPVLASALASFDCRVLNGISVGSHTVYIAEVLSVEMCRDPHAPLLYLDGGYFRFGRPFVPATNGDPPTLSATDRPSPR
jgi:flavin reductase